MSIGFDDVIGGLGDILGLGTGIFSFIDALNRQAQLQRDPRFAYMMNTIMSHEPLTMQGLGAWGETPEGNPLSFLDFSSNTMANMLANPVITPGMVNYLSASSNPPVTPPTTPPPVPPQQGPPPVPPAQQPQQPATPPLSGNSGTQNPTAPASTTRPDQYSTRARRGEGSRTPPAPSTPPSAPPSVVPPTGGTSNPNTERDPFPNNPPTSNQPNYMSLLSSPAALGSNYGRQTATSQPSPGMVFPGDPGYSDAYRPGGPIPGSAPRQDSGSWWDDLFGGNNNQSPANNGGQQDNQWLQTILSALGFQSGGNPTGSGIGGYTPGGLSPAGGGRFPGVGNTHDPNAWLPNLLSSLGIPSYDVGTPYVPRDQLAVVHQGEAIIPANQNPANPQRRAYPPGIQSVAPGQNGGSRIMTATAPAQPGYAPTPPQSRQIPTQPTQPQMPAPTPPPQPPSLGIPREVARQLGRMDGGVYDTLRNSGMSHEQIFEMHRDAVMQQYLASLAPQPGQSAPAQQMAAPSARGYDIPAPTTTATGSPAPTPQTLSPQELMNLVSQVPPEVQQLIGTNQDIIAELMGMQGPLTAGVQSQILSSIRDARDLSLQNSLRQQNEELAARGIGTGNLADYMAFQGQLARDADMAEAQRQLGIDSATTNFNSRLNALNAAQQNITGLGGLLTDQQRLALQAYLGEGDLDVRNRGLDIQQLLGQSDLDLRRELGLGDLDVRNRALDIQEELGRLGINLSQQQLDQLIREQDRQYALAQDMQVWSQLMGNNQFNLAAILGFGDLLTSIGGQNQQFDMDALQALINSYFGGNTNVEINT